jgi:hypothetical protein
MTAGGQGPNVRPRCLLSMRPERDTRGACKPVSMGVAKFRLDLLRAFADNPGRHTTEDVGKLVGADERGLGYDEIKGVLDGLLDARLVVWEAGGEHLWRISAQGRDHLASARG